MIVTLHSYFVKYQQCNKSLEGCNMLHPSVNKMLQDNILIFSIDRTVLAIVTIFEVGLLRSFSVFQNHGNRGNLENLGEKIPIAYGKIPAL